MAKYAGVPFKIGEREYIVPALSLGLLRNGLLAKIKEHDDLVAEGKLFDTLALRGDIIIAALRRNYPDIDENEVFDYLDMTNTTQIWLAVLGASGFTSAGEATAGTEPEVPTVPAPTVVKAA